jgi:CBS domain-containing protein
MDTKKVKDLMISLDNYASVHQDSTLYQAIVAIRQSQEKLAPGMQPIRAVLIVDDKKNIVGKMGHLAILRALEPKYGNIVDLEKLTRAGVSSDLIMSITNNLRLWQEDLTSIWKRAQTIKIKDVMNPVSESIDENASLTDAMHQIIMLQCLSLLVKRGSNVVGILRLSDIYHEVEQNIIEENKH